MLHANWDLLIGDGQPGCAALYEEGEQSVQYYRFGHDDTVEPLVFARTFHGTAPDYLEVSEEFRLFHNLWWDAKRSAHVAFDESGDAEDVIIVNADEVKIRSKHLKQYLAIRDLVLLIYFDLERKSSTPISALGLADQRVSVTEPELRYEIYSGDVGSHTEPGSFTRLFGKKLIRGMAKEKCGIWPYEEPKQYTEFMIQRSAGREPELWSADPIQLANYFGANPEAPHYLTPVFFRREVLNKYYSNPERYSVEDGYLRASGQWGMDIDNDLPDHVAAFLGDLGRDLPYKEQLYWRSFNVEPAGLISKVNYCRSILGVFTSPTRPDLLFKQEFGNFNDDWQRRFGWPLFKPLSGDDRHFWVSLRVPLAETQAEFDNQVLSISKVVVDSLNESELAKSTPKSNPGDKGITKLHNFLAVKGVQSFDDHIRFLRNLWDLRHGAGHRKGESYVRAARFFGVGERGFVSSFAGILCDSTALLKFLRAALLPHSDGFGSEES